MKVLITSAVVAAGLAIVLLWRSPSVGRGTYCVAFFLGLGALAAFLFGRGEVSWEVRTPSVGFVPSQATFMISLVVAAYLAVTPYLLLLESGIAGYRGFSSWVRYVCLGLAFLGGAGLLASFLLPQLLRRYGGS